jgi:hypothetical protein
MLPFVILLNFFFKIFFFIIFRTASRLFPCLVVGFLITRARRFLSRPFFGVYVAPSSAHGAPSTVRDDVPYFS